METICKNTPPPADPRFARFGEAMWKFITCKGGDFCGGELSEGILPLAQSAGLCCRIEYDPELHGEGIESDPGDEIWWWGDNFNGHVKDHTTKPPTEESASAYLDIEMAGRQLAEAKESWREDSMEWAFLTLCDAENAIQSAKAKIGRVLQSRHAGSDAPGAIEKP